MFHPARQMRFNFLEDPGNQSLAAEMAPSGNITLPQGTDVALEKICQDLLADLGLEDLRRRVSVEWNSRMRSCAGRAFWPKGSIQLNPKLGGISKAEIRQTLLHELAHLIAYERHAGRRIKSHGEEWQQACAEVGIPGEKATHQLSLPTRVMKRKWRYECPECDQVIERVRRFKSAVACYHCCLEKTGGVFHRSFQLVEYRLGT